MPTSILLNGVPFTGTGVYEGFTYDKLVGWYELAPVDSRMVKRPNQPGAFSVDQTSPEQAALAIEGQFFGLSEAESILAREQLLALYNDGRPVEMRVSDAVRVTRRQVQVVAVSIPWTFRREFTFAIDMVAADPKRYGTPEVVSNGLAVAGSGLLFASGVPTVTPFILTEAAAGSGNYQTSPLLESPAGSGNYDASLLTSDGNGNYLTSGATVSGVTAGLTYPIDFGTTPNDGRITVTNEGNSETTSTFVIRDGSMPDGANIINVATGERLTYTGPLVEGTFLEFDPRVQAVFVNGTNPSGRYLPDPAWWTVAPGESLTIQFLARGPVTGKPVLEATTSPAFY